MDISFFSFPSITSAEKSHHKGVRHRFHLAPFKEQVKPVRISILIPSEKEGLRALHLAILFSEKH